jgi:hypothetical protein
MYTVEMKCNRIQARVEKHLLRIHDTRILKSVHEYIPTDRSNQVNQGKDEDQPS